MEQKNTEERRNGALYDVAADVEATAESMHVIYVPDSMGQVLNEIFSEYNLKIALAKVRRKEHKRIHGLSNCQLNNMVKDRIRAIYNKSYVPGKVRICNIPKPNGTGIRTLAIAPAVDRVIASCINDYLYPIYMVDWTDSCFGFRLETGCIDEVKTIVDYLNMGHKFAVSIDLMKCFDNINLDQARFLINQKIEDDDLRKIINMFLRAQYTDGTNKFVKDVGTPQGNPLSPLICNIVLDVIDKELVKRGRAFTRYADDIVILTKSRKAAEQAMRSTKKLIETKTKIPVNEEKSEIHNIKDGFVILGFYIYKDDGNVVHYVPASRSISKLKANLKDIITKEKHKHVIQKCNDYIRGWFEYYKFSEINGLTKDLDFWINKKLDHKEKICGIKITSVCLLQLKNARKP